MEIKNGLITKEKKEFVLVPEIPKNLILEDENVVELKTQMGDPLVSIVLISSNGNVLIKNSLNGQSIVLSNLGTYYFGFDKEPNIFFETSQIYISRNHFAIELVEILFDGRVSLNIRDCNSRNGTMIIVEASPEIPLLIEFSVLAGGKEGKISTKNGESTAITNKGLRDFNEDGVFISTNQIALADGMGGHEAGEEASKSALMAVKNMNGKAFNIDYFDAICDKLDEDNLPNESGTTLAVVRKIPSSRFGMNTIEIGNVGDSKICVISLIKNRIIWESTDQSKVQKMLDFGILTDSLQRYTHPQKNIVTNAISRNGLLENPEFIKIEVPIGSALVVIVSDGVSDFVSPEEILEIALLERQFCAQTIYNLAYSRQGKPFDIKLEAQLMRVPVSGTDNISVAVMLG